MREKLETIKKVIDAQEYTDDFLDRAENAAVSARCKKRSDKIKRG